MANSCNDSKTVGCRGQWVVEGVSFWVFLNVPDQIQVKCLCKEFELKTIEEIGNLWAQGSVECTLAPRHCLRLGMFVKLVK